MKKHEASEKYNIPLNIFDEYEKCCLCGETKQQYNDADLENLSMIMTLYDVGFGCGEVKKYMELLEQGKSTEKERMLMLEKRCCSALDEIHLKEKQLECLNCLKHKLKTNK